MRTIRCLLLVLSAGILLSPNSADCDEPEHRITLQPIDTLSWFSLFILQDFFNAGSLRKTLWKEAQRYWLNHPEPELCQVGFLKNAEQKDSGAAAAGLPSPSNPEVTQEDPESLLPLYYALSDPVQQPPEAAAIAQNMQLVVPDALPESGVPPQLVLQILEMLNFYPSEPVFNFNGEEPSLAEQVVFRNQAVPAFRAMANTLIGQLLAADGQFTPCLVCGQRIRAVYLQRRQPGDYRTVIIQLNGRNRLQVKHYYDSSNRNPNRRGCQTSYVFRLPELEEVEDDELPDPCSCIEQHRRSQWDGDHDHDAPPPGGPPGLVN